MSSKSRPKRRGTAAARWADRVAETSTPGYHEGKWRPAPGMYGYETITDDAEPVYPGLGLRCDVCGAGALAALTQVVDDTGAHGLQLRLCGDCHPVFFAATRRNFLTALPDGGVAKDNVLGGLLAMLVDLGQDEALLAAMQEHPARSQLTRLAKRTRGVALGDGGTA